MSKKKSSVAFLMRLQKEENGESQNIYIGFTSLSSFLPRPCFCIVLFRFSHIMTKTHTHTHTSYVHIWYSLGKRMRVNLNISFPAIHCDDIHLDVMDVAGDSHIGLDTSMIKRRLDINTGLPMNRNTIEVRANGNALQDKQRQDVLKTELPPDYCGPCYGAKPLTENGCCDTCEDVLEAYRKMRWNDEAVQPLAEQCIREGKGNTEPTKMKGGEGCNLSGHFTVNRVGGNFHIAMGAGVDRGGSHVHNFLPEDRINFNTSHVVHDLRFLDAQYTTVSGEGGSSVDELSSKTGVNGERSMNGVSKFVTEETGTTGLFQYFIKVVPTRYKGEIIHDLVGGSNLEKTKHVPGDEEHILETNRYFYTERFRPLIGEVHEEALLDGDAEYGTAGVHVGGRHSGGTLQERMSHHETTNAVLPGIFFVYEIYPFAVEVTRNRVPFMHLLTRIMATVGGVFTIMSLIDGALYAREKKKIGGGSRR